MVILRTLGAASLAALMAASRHADADDLDPVGVSAQPHGGSVPIGLGMRSSALPDRAGGKPPPAMADAARIVARGGV